MKSKTTLVRPERASTHASVEQPAPASTKQNIQEKKIGNISPLYRGGKYISFLSTKNEKEKEGEIVLGFDDVLELALLLTPEDRKLLQAELSLAGQESGKAQSRDISMWSRACHSQLSTALHGEGGGVLGPLAFQRVLGSPTNWAPVWAFMQAARLDQLEVVRRQRVYIMLAELLVDHAHKISLRYGAPLSVKLLASTAANLASLFDQAFPGYVKAGLAHLVATA